MLLLGVACAVGMRYGETSVSDEHFHSASVIEQVLECELEENVPDTPVKPEAPFAADRQLVLFTTLGLRPNTSVARHSYYVTPLTRAPPHTA